MSLGRRLGSQLACLYSCHLRLGFVVVSHHIQVGITIQTSAVINIQAYITLSVFRAVHHIVAVFCPLESHSIFDWDTHDSFAIVSTMSIPESSSTKYVESLVQTIELQANRQLVTAMDQRQQPPSTGKISTKYRSQREATWRSSFEHRLQKGHTSLARGSKTDLHT